MRRMRGSLTGCAPSGTSNEPLPATASVPPVAVCPPRAYAARGGDDMSGMLRRLRWRPGTSEARGYVDQLTAGRIAGWVHDPAAGDRPGAVDIVINDEHVARLTACVFRQDLARLGYGDGRRGFVFDPSGYLHPGENRVRVSAAGSDQPLPHGAAIVLHVGGVDAARAVAEADLLELSQVRWKGDEEEHRLTWGSVMTGDTFVDVVEHHHPLTAGDVVLEIGPGYGRLLRTLQERRLPFARYVGLELSGARVERLMQRFGGPTVAFVQGDVLAGPPPVQPTLVLCSSTFEHLFPSMAKALRHLRAVTTPAATLCIDFIMSEGDDDLRVSRAYFENTSAYIRIYARAELERFFAEAGFRVVAIEPLVLGRDHAGRDVRRALVVATPRADHST